jgi:hypothetical protein
VHVDVGWPYILTTIFTACALSLTRKRSMRVRSCETVIQMSLSVVYRYVTLKNRIEGKTG